RSARAADGDRPGGGLQLGDHRGAGARDPARLRGRAMRFDPAYLRHVVERLESFRSHPLGFRVAGTPEERKATAFIMREMPELGLRGAKAMIVYCPPGGPYYQAPNALGTFDGIWHEEAPPCVTIRKEDAPKVEGRVRVVLRAPLTRGAEAANVVGVLPGRRRA